MPILQLNVDYSTSVQESNETKNTTTEIHTNVYGVNKNDKEWSDKSGHHLAPTTSTTQKLTSRNRKEKTVTREYKAVTMISRRNIIFVPEHNINMFLDHNILAINKVLN